MIGCPREETATLVAATAKLAGAPGTNWVSDVALLNRGAETATATVSLWLRDRPNPSPERRTLTLTPGELRREGDVLTSLFGLESGAAVLEIRSDRPLVVSSRTYNDTGAGTYGQFIPGVGGEEAFTAGETAYLAGLVEDGAYRSNLGLVNPTATEVEVAASFFAADGSPLGPAMTYPVPARSSVMVSRVLRGVTQGEVEGAWASLQVGEGSFLAFVSVVDEATGDPVYRPAQRVSGEAVDALLAGAAKLSGSGATNWVTDTTFLNTSSEAGEILVTLWPRQGETWPAEQATFTLPAHQQWTAPDVIGGVFALEGGAGALEVEGAPGLLADGRTYNLVATGTYGQYIPARSRAQALSSGRVAYLAMVAQGPEYRTNLGLSNVTDTPAEVEVRLHGPSGATLGGTERYPLPARGVGQVNQVVREFTAADLEAGYLELRIAASTPEAAVHAYASVVDQRTGDPIFEAATVVEE